MYQDAVVYMRYMVAILVTVVSASLLSLDESIVVLLLVVLSPGTVVLLVRGLRNTMCYTNQYYNTHSIQHNNQLTRNTITQFHSIQIT